MYASLDNKWCAHSTQKELMSFRLQSPSMSPTHYATDVPFLRYWYLYPSCGSKQREEWLSLTETCGFYSWNLSSTKRFYLLASASAHIAISCMGYRMQPPHWSSCLQTCSSVTWFLPFKPWVWSCHLCLNTCNDFLLPLDEVHSYRSIVSLLVAPFGISHIFFYLSGIQDLRC